jgi:2-C-methyl-D-erythritol 2,4-cyclodiphosphate synthase
MSQPLSGLRCGIGYDTHRLAEGRRLVLGGVEIASLRGPISHSDGDVLSHAIADALLGAAGLGDLGRRFPDTDAQWKGVSSLMFLETVRKLLDAEKLRIENIDSVLVLDEPKLAPYMDRVAEGIARALGVDRRQVSVKAKTSEGATPLLAAAHAVALLAPLRGMRNRKEK